MAFRFTMIRWWYKLPVVLTDQFRGERGLNKDGTNHPSSRR